MSPGSIANSWRMLTEINKSSAVAEIRIWVESDYVKHLETFRIISNEMQIKVDDIVVVCIFR